MEQADLWRRGTMTVIRSVFVPDDGWLLRTPGRPSLHLRESRADPVGEEFDVRVHNFSQSSPHHHVSVQGDAAFI